MHHLHASDLDLLLHLFAEKHHTTTVCDPERRIRGVISKGAPAQSGQHVLVRAGQGAADPAAELILDLGHTPALKGYQRTVLHTITHADGSIRWMYAPGAFASVLHFHNAAGLRGRVLGWGVRVAAALGLDRVLRSGILTLHHRAPLKLTALLNGMGHERCAYFMGTPGAQRKISVVLERAGQALAFAKVAINEGTLTLLGMERKALRDVHALRCPSLVVPQAYEPKDAALLVQTNVALPGFRRSTTFTPVHAAAVVGFAQGRVDTSAQKGHLAHARLCHRLEQIERTGPVGIQRRLLDQLRAAATEFGLEDGFAVAPAHGDLTPWNSYCSDDQLALYDWEMYSADAPLLYDLVHFHMQQGIIVDRAPFVTIRERIHASCELPELRSFLATYGVDVDACLRWYLVEAVSRFLLVYSAQARLSDTQLRQLVAWEYALASMVSGTARMAEQRSGFLEDLAAHLRQRPHAFLKYRWNTLAELPIGSDLDLVVERDAVDRTIAFARQHPLVRRVRVVRKSFMSTVELFFHDEGFLSLDLIHRFQRKHLRMLDAAEVLREAVPTPVGLMVPAFKHDLAYTFLFHQANGSRIPTAYRAFFDARSEHEWGAALAYLSTRCDLWFTGAEAFWNADPKVYMRSIRRSLAQRMTTVSKFAEGALYLLDSVRGMISGRGFLVTFSGVDGAGKSTVIAQVKQELEGTFRREVVLMRHRPGLLPMLNAWRVGAAKAEELATHTLPRTGTNKGTVSSLFRFAYYFLDYAIGQWVVYFRHVLRGRIVLYDRYYFDFMADPRRSNLHLSRTLTHALYAFVHTPKLNFFLYADSATILQRKQELSAADVEQLTQRYRSLFERLANRAGRARYRTIRNEDLATTLSGIRYEFAQAA